MLYFVLLTTHYVVPRADKQKYRAERRITTMPPQSYKHDSSKRNFSAVTTVSHTQYPSGDACVYTPSPLSLSARAPH